MFNLKFLCLTSLITLAYVAELHAACSTATLKGVYRYNLNATVQGHQCHGTGRLLYDGNGGGWNDGSMVCQGAGKKFNTSAPSRYELNSNCTGRDWGPDGTVDQLRVDSNRNISMFFNDPNKRISGKASGKRIGNLALADTRKIKNGLANWNKFASNNNQQNQHGQLPPGVEHSAIMIFNHAALFSDCTENDAYDYPKLISGVAQLFSICKTYNYQQACDNATLLLKHHSVMCAANAPV